MTQAEDCGSRHLDILKPGMMSDRRQMTLKLKQDDYGYTIYTSK